MRTFDPLLDKTTLKILCSCDSEERSIVQISKETKLTPQTLHRKIEKLVELKLLEDSRGDDVNQKNARKLITDAEKVTAHFVKVNNLGLTKGEENILNKNFAELLDMNPVALVKMEEDFNLIYGLYINLIMDVQSFLQDSPDKTPKALKTLSRKLANQKVFGKYTHELVDISLDNLLNVFKSEEKYKFKIDISKYEMKSNQP